MDNMLIWNCRGAGNKRFPGLIKDYTRIYKLGFLAVLEPRISGIRADRVIEKLGYDGIAREEAVGFAGGIWCLWKKNKFSIDVISSSKYCILLKISPHSRTPWLLSVVYGSPQERFREDLWNELRDIHSNFNLPWCVAGDFNSVLHAHEKEGGGEFNMRAGQRFAQCLFYCNLLDLGCKGPLFTWRSGSLKERLDRALCNSQWQNLFPCCSVINLPLLSSDHCGVWIKLEGDPQKNDQRYFKFLGPWLEHEDFHSQVCSSWRNSDSWNINIARLSKTLSTWNRTVFGNIFQRKKRLLGHLEGIDRQLINGSTERLSRLKQDLWTEYNSLLDQEEAYWFQQARSKWLRLGDHNTRYFHQKTLVRRRTNKIEALLNNEGEWVYEDHNILNAIVTNFNALFSSVSPITNNLQTISSFPLS